MYSFRTGCRRANLTMFFHFVSLFLLSQLSSASSHMYSAQDHPLKTLPTLSHADTPITPVVMNRYYISHKYVGPRSATNSLYVPRNVSYVHHDTDAPFVRNADALQIGTHYPNTKADPTDFGKIHLNRKARVFALMFSFHNFYHPPNPGFSPVMTGMPEGWTVIGAVRTITGYEIRVGNPDRHGSAKLPKRALAVEVLVEHDETSDTGGYIVRFPHPWSMRMNGDVVKTMAFLLVEYVGQETGVDNLQPFTEPSLPDPFMSFSPDGEPGEMVHPQNDKPVPNKTCPKWLHDIHVVDLASRWDASDIHADEPRYWRTWHPMIDSIYWCYYDHDHGSYPGKSYRPAFAYTAWKTRDNSTVDGRETESHKGFKVYYIPVEDDRSIVLTTHLHISKARRFTTRFHSVMFVVMRGHGGDEEVEVELSFKSDFGPAMAQDRLGVPIPLDDTQRIIKHEIEVNQRRGSRIFNVINIDENFPDSLDPKFRVKGYLSRGPVGILNGLYESWRTTFPSCTTPRNKYDGAFEFQVRDPSTAARFPVGTTDTNIQVMNGLSLRRVLIFGVPVLVSLHQCVADMGMDPRANDGLFFTDAYMKESSTAVGSFRIRQFISPSFANLTIRAGFIRANDPWSGTYTYNGSPGLQHIESAILKMKN